MKKLLITLFLSVFAISGCGPMTPENQMAWQQFWQSFSQQQQLYQQQRMYDAQYNYYTRPYKVGGVTYIPPRR